MTNGKLICIAACIVSLTIVGCKSSDHASVNIEVDQDHFINPVIYSDVPDIDVIRQGVDYYMVSTTMHTMPGCPVLHSKDLVNWNIVSYVFDTLHESKANDLEDGNIYSRGQWAPCIRFHDGCYYVLFGTGNKSYIYRASDPTGEWTLLTTFDKYYHDASLLFDDDGRVYLVYGSGVIKIIELKDDLTGLKPYGLKVTVTEREPEGLLEGSHIYKFNGKYYITMIWWPDGGIRTQVCFRSDDIRGPYNFKTILSDDLGFPHHGVAQGCFLDTAVDDNWYAMLFQDHEAVGRVPVLTQMRWVDGWPVLGNAEGKVDKVMKKPLGDLSPKTAIVSSDEFDSDTLGLNWEWNHNPDNSAWTLTERPGYLRLKTNKTVKGLFSARNTLTQRTMGPRCSGAVSIDFSGMQDGDHAGLSIFCAEPGTIEVVKEQGKYYVVMTDRGKVKAKEQIDGSVVYLKADCKFGKDVAKFYYSTDGENFTRLGKKVKLIYNLVHFTGNKFAIFYYSTATPGGYVDVDWFHLDM